MPFDYTIYVNFTLYCMCMVEVVDYRPKLAQSVIDSDIIKIFDNLLTVGVEEGASDIHIEPMENYSRIRLRIDGELEELIQFPRNLHESIISKFKIESGQMRPDEKRLPQDARVSSVTQTNKEIDLRANTLPTIWWEKLVMRIVDKSKKVPPLSELGIDGSNSIIMYKHLEDPNGVFLMTGPTGSGKTATLYACLNHINTPNVNIITYEDPVENKMAGLSQVQVRSDIGFTFASGLRSALRQDPDVIMVWEIRDKETLSMAMEAAMTWHLVFSTIHTNSAAETITRVLNFGAKAYMIAGSFNLVVAERLARRSCPKCRTSISIKDTSEYRHALKSFENYDPEALKKEIKSRNITEEQWKMFMADGMMFLGSWKDEHWAECPLCKWSGYKWRIGLFEMMDYNDDIKTLLLDWKSAFEIETYALQHGMINLERDWIFKIIQWVTTLEEVYSYVKTKIEI